MLEAARELLAEGITATVEQVAERAAISRTTAYRYFPNQRALLIATYPELAAPSLLDGEAPADPAARLECDDRVALARSQEQPVRRPRSVPIAGEPPPRSACLDDPRSARRVREQPTLRWE